MMVTAMDPANDQQTDIAPPAAELADSPTIVLAGGGTGGHLYPGISVAQALRALIPRARILFLVTRRDIDRTILEPTGLEFIPQPIVPPLKTITGLLKFWRSWRATQDLVARLLRDRPPAAVLGLGGYAAGVAVKLAAQAGIATAVVNPDAIPGKANQYLMRSVAAVCCQFEATRDHVKPEFQSKLRITGCPVRQDILDAAASPDRAAAAQRLGLDPSLRTLVVTGASQGAQTVNEAMLKAIPSLKLQGWQVLHLAGKDHAPAVRQAYRQQSLEGTVVDFTPRMADVWSVCDLAISRAGASTCAEMTACGIPSILMPYPFHKDMHQRANARVLEAAGAARLIDDQRDAIKNAAALGPLLSPLLHDVDRRKAMASAARSLGRPDAANGVAQVLLDLIAAKS